MTGLGRICAVIVRKRINMTHKDKELVFILRKCWAKHPELQLAATRIEKLNAKVDEWRIKYDNLLQSAFKQSGGKT